MSDTFYGEVKLYNNEDLFIVSYFKRKKTLLQTEVVALLQPHFLLSVAFTNPKNKIRS